MSNQGQPVAYIAPTDSAVIESGSAVQASGVVVPKVFVYQASAIVIEVTSNIT